MDETLNQDLSVYDNTVQGLDGQLQLAYVTGMTPEEVEMGEDPHPEPTDAEPQEAQLEPDPATSTTTLQGGVEMNAVQEIGAGLGFGAESALNAGADLIDMGIQQGFKPLATGITGLTSQELDQYAPWLLTELDGPRENLLFKKMPQGFLGQGSSLVGQYAVGLTLASGLVRSLPLVGTVGASVLSKLPSFVGTLAEGTTLGSLAETIGFKTEQGNLVSFLENVGALNSDAGQAINEALNTEGDEDTFVGRLKNGLASVAGDGLALSTIASVKLLKALKGKNASAIKAAAQELSEADEVLQGTRPLPTTQSTSQILDDLSVPATDGLLPASQVGKSVRKRVPLADGLAGVSDETIVDSAFDFTGPVSKQQVFKDINLSTKAGTEQAHAAFKTLLGSGQSTLTSRIPESAPSVLKRLTETHYQDLNKLAIELGASPIEVLLAKAPGDINNLDKAMLNAYSLKATSLETVSKIRTLVDDPEVLTIGSPAFNEYKNLVNTTLQAEKALEQIKSGFGRGLQSAQRELGAEGVGLAGGQGVTVKDSIDRMFKSGAPIGDVLKLADTTVIDDDYLIQIAQLARGAEPSTAQKFLSNLGSTVSKGTKLTSDVVSELYYGTLLTSIGTAKMASMSSGILKGYYDLSDIVGSGIVDSVRMGLTGKADFKATQHAVDKLAAVPLVLVDAFVAAARLGLSRDTTEIANIVAKTTGNAPRPPVITADNLGLGKVPFVAPLVDTFGTGVRVGERALAMSDVFYTSIGDKAYLYADAMARVRGTGLKMGSAEAKAFVDTELESTYTRLQQYRQGELTADASKGITPLSDFLARQAGRVNLNMSYADGDNGIFAAGEGLDNFLLKFPLAKTALSPFTKVYVNMLSAGVDGLPIAAITQRNQKALSGALGVREQAQAVGNISMGVVTGAVGLELFRSGRLNLNITGVTNQANAERATGRSGRTLTIAQGDGSSYEMSLDALGPIGDILTTYAYMNQSVDYMNAGEQTLAMGVMLSMMQEMAGSQRFMASFNKVLSVLADDNIKGSEKLNSLPPALVANLVPGSRFVQEMQYLTDPYLKEMDGLFGVIQTRIPGMTSEVNVRVGIFGQKMVAPKSINIEDLSDWTTPEAAMALTEALTPFSTKKVSQDPVASVLNGFAKKGLTIPSMPKTLSEYTVPINLGDFKDSKGETAYHAMQRSVGTIQDGSGRTIRELLNEAVMKPEFQNLSDSQGVTLGGRSGVYRGSKWTFINEAISNVRKAAKEEVLARGKEYLNQQGQTLEEVLIKNQLLPQDIEAKNDSKSQQLKDELR